MKYQYSIVSGQATIKGGYAKRPVIEVEISRDEQKRKFLALIDSGADHIIMPAAIADVFGIKKEDSPARPVIGISMERSEGFVGNLTFRLQHQPKSFDAPVVFIDTDVPVLLGREGFFDQYRIKFEQDHDTFEITPAPRR